MSETTLLIASVERLFKILEVRIEAIEKKVFKEFVHNSSGYTKGCRCQVCKDARAKSMRKYRKMNQRPRGE